MVCIEIKTHDKRVYEALLDYVKDVCDSLHLVVRDDLDKSPSVEAFIEKARPHLIQEKRQNQWPGTSLCGNHTARVLYYRLTDTLINEISSQATSFFDWLHPALPEDLTFYKGEREVLITTAHEKELYILIQNPDEITGLLDHCQAQYQVHPINLK